MKFRHVAIAVKDVRAVRILWKKLGFRCSRVYDDPWFDFVFVKVKTSPIPLYLMEPKSGRGPIARFIRKHGPGLHHIAFTVDNLQETIRKLRRKHLRTLRTVDEGFSLVTFLDPKKYSGVLIELNQPRELKRIQLRKLAPWRFF